MSTPRNRTQILIPNFLTFLRPNRPLSRRGVDTTRHLRHVVEIYLDAGEFVVVGVAGLVEIC